MTMENAGLHQHGRLCSVEFRVLARRRIWLMLLPIVGLYGILSALNVKNGISDHLLNPWQIGVMVLGGPSFQASVLKILEWLIIPGAFVLGVGEPYSLLATSWNQLVLVRVPSRWRFWWGRTVTWYGWALLYGLVVLGIGVVAGKMAHPSAAWGIPQTLSLDNLQIENGFLLIAWVGLSLVATLWGYTTLLLLFSLFFSRPGVATIFTLVVGYGLTALGVNVPSVISYLRPLLGARLNLFPDTNLNGNDFLSLGISTGVWVFVGVLAGYSLFHRRSI
ncbi:MAG: hypothetical protein C0P64_000335 [Bacillota bacterium]